jgi:hypothetical protein
VKFRELGVGGVRDKVTERRERERERESERVRERERVCTFSGDVREPNPHFPKLEVKT